MARFVYRCAFWSVALACIGIWLAPTAVAQDAAAADSAKPNIILVTADEMNWHDAGFNGNAVGKTPVLDQMVMNGLRFDYFYPGGSLCAPSRFALLAGRSPLRGGVSHLLPIRPNEIILPKALKQAGYASAHFGKFHLTTRRTSPVSLGYDYARWAAKYFDFNAKFHINDTNDVIETQGDGSLAIMDLALEYVRQQAEAKQPFFLTVCFGSPHSPYRALPELRDIYQSSGKRADYWGEITALDAAVGRLRTELRRLGIADDTLLWFTSDCSGPVGRTYQPTEKTTMLIGVRVPGVLEWPARIKKPLQTSVPCSHLDVYPTLLDLLGIQVPNQPPLDGISLIPLFDGRLTERPKPLAFTLLGGVHKQWLPEDFARADFVADFQGVLIDQNSKLIVEPSSARSRPGVARLYDIQADPAEQTNLAERQPQVVARLRSKLETWQRSVRASYDGKDAGRRD